MFLGRIDKRRVENLSGRGSYSEGVNPEGLWSTSFEILNKCSYSKGFKDGSICGLVGKKKPQKSSVV